MGGQLRLTGYRRDPLGSLDLHDDVPFAEMTEAEREVAPLARTPDADDVAAAVLGLLGVYSWPAVSTWWSRRCKHLMYGPFATEERGVTTRTETAAGL